MEDYDTLFWDFRNIEKPEVTTMNGNISIFPNTRDTLDTILYESLKDPTLRVILIIRQKLDAIHWNHFLLTFRLNILHNLKSMIMETKKKKGLLALASSKDTDIVIMPINRLAILSDIIFALAMTSMLFAIDLPTAEDVSNTEELLIYFENRPPGTIIYLLSFLLVAVYWFKHLERFQYYKKTNTTHQWIEIGFLAFLMLVPLMNTWTMVLPGNPIPLTAYSIMMFLVGFFAFLSWNYATRKKELINEGLSSDVIRNIKHESLVEPIIALVSIGMAWIKPLFWNITLFMIPIFFIIQKRITRYYEKREKHLIDREII